MAEASWARRLLVGYLQGPAGLRALAPLACMGLLWWTSSLPRPGGGGGDVSSFLHNGAHVIAYGGLAAVWLLLLLRSAAAWSRPQVALAVLLAGCYGVVDELHQASVPGRVSSPSDVLTDLVGGWLGAAVVLAVLGSARARAGLPWLCLGAVGCVAFATWGPW